MASTVAIRELARRVAGVERELANFATTPQLSSSSIENGGSLVVNTGTGADSKEVLQIGGQFDGDFTANPLVGAPPPQPTAPILTATPGGLVARWDGEFLDSLFPPTGFSRVEVHIGPNEGFDASFASTLRGTIETPRGTDVVVNDLPTGTVWVKLICRNMAGARGPDSPAASVAIERAPTARETLEALNEALEAQERATMALTAADGKSKLWYATVAPTSAEGSDGDTWWERDVATGNVVKVYEKKDGAWVERKLAGSTIDTLSAGQITTGTLAAGASITVGDPNGVHVKLLGNAITVNRPNTDGEVEIGTQLGGTSDQVLIRQAGAIVAGIFANGDVTGQDAEFASLSVGGETIEEKLDRLPQGHVAGFILPTSSIDIKTDTANGTNLFSVRWSGRAGRRYRLHYNMKLFATLTGSALGRAYMAFHLRHGNGNPSMDDPSLAFDFQTIQPSGLNMLQFSGSYPVNQISSTNTLMHVLCRVYNPLYASVQWSGYIYSQAPGWSGMFIEDIGPAEPGTSAMSTMYSSGVKYSGSSGGVPVDPVDTPTTYVKEYTASWARTFRNGSTYSYTDDLFQGTYGSNRHTSMVGFPAQVQADLAGATVKKVELFLYAYHWRYGSGGTFKVGAHGATSAPTAFATSMGPYDYTWTKPGYGRWVTLNSAVNPYWASGAHKGFTLSSYGSDAWEYYGKAYGPAGTTNASMKPKLRVTYEK